jgi:hypothetical protein
MVSFPWMILLSVLAVVGLALALSGLVLALTGLALLLCGRSREKPTWPPGPGGFSLHPDDTAFPPSCCACDRCSLTPAPPGSRPSFRP